MNARRHRFAATLFAALTLFALAAGAAPADLQTLDAAQAQVTLASAPALELDEDLAEPTCKAPIPCLNPIAFCICLEEGGREMACFMFSCPE